MKKIKLLSPLFLTLILVGCSSGNSNSEIAKLQEENAELKKQLKNEGTLNDTEKPNKNESKSKIVDNLVLKNNEDLFLIDSNNTEVANFIVTNVSTAQESFPDYMITLDDYDTTKMISVTIDYTNLALDEGFIPSVHDFQAYDKDGNSLERPSQQEGQDYVSIGRKSQTKIFFITPKNSSEYDKIEIDYVSGLKKIATFDLSVSH